MKRAIIVSQAGQEAETAGQVLRAAGFVKTAEVSGCAEARRYLTDDVLPDIMIINSPLPDESGHELALMAASAAACGVIFIVPGNIADETADSFAGSGIRVITRPLNRKILTETIAELSAGTPAVDKESPDLLIRIDEIRLINKAKRTLMEYLGFTEPQAHRYIEKQAMDNRQTRLEVAEKIISSYDK